jgi:hypothetical protein
VIQHTASAHPLQEILVRERDIECGICGKGRHGHYRYNADTPHTHTDSTLLEEQALCNGLRDSLYQSPDLRVGIVLRRPKHLNRASLVNPE